MENKRDSKYVIDVLTRYFKEFYGGKLDSLIDERIKNLVDIIFYNNHTVTKNIDDIAEYLDEYEIDKYKNEIINKELPMSKYILETGQQGTMIYEKDEKLRMIIYFPITMGKQYNYDCVLIHELLHVLDEHVTYSDSNLIISSGGFESTVLKGEKQIERKYEVLNEILHQRISEEINEYLYDEDVLIYNTKEEKKKSIEKYKSDRCEVIEYFYENFKEKLLTCKLIGTIDELINYVGKENFEEFNKWIIDFYDTYKTPEDRMKAKNSEKFIEKVNIGMDIINKMIDKSKQTLIYYFFYA